MRISRSGRTLMRLALVLLVAACASGTTDTTDAAVEAETTAAPVETTAGESPDPGSVGSFEDMPRECMDALREYLVAIEPIVEDVDFQSTTMEEFETLGEDLAEATEGFEERTDSCPELDISTEESFARMREFAEDEAPGTVAYFEFIEEFAGSFEGGGTASGDCETDIAAFQVYVDQADSMSDLTASEVAAASSLMSNIAVECSPERFLEWQEDLGDWISG